MPGVAAIGCYSRHSGSSSDQAAVDLMRERLGDPLTIEELAVTLKMCKSEHSEWRKANGIPYWRAEPEGFGQRC